MNKLYLEWETRMKFYQCVDQHHNFFVSIIRLLLLLLLLLIIIIIIIIVSFSHELQHLQEFEWEQVSSGIQDSSECSSCSHQYFSQDDLGSSSDFPFLHPVFPCDCVNYSQCTHNNLYQNHRHVLHIITMFFILLLLFTPLEFFTSVLPDGFSLEFEWQQVSSNLQDSSQDSCRS